MLTSRSNVQREPRVVRYLDRPAARVRWLRECEACGELTLGLLCTGCVEHSRPHLLEDPYDDLGGESGCP